MIHVEGKKVYWVNGVRFYNSKDKRDGRAKAEAYCLDNFLPLSSIIQFDSDTETDYYDYLLEQQRNGLIAHLDHHFVLKVQDAFINSNGDEIPAVVYEADFVYRDLQTNKRVVVDVKSSEYFLGNDGGRFILLKSLFDKVFLEKDIYIKIILRKNKTEWYEWHIGDKKKSQKMLKKQREQISQLKQELKLKAQEERQASRERAKAEKQALKEKLKLEKQVQKEKETIIKYREWRDNSHGLTKQQRLKLAELEAKYTI